jgi:hypothetical protein
MDALLMQKADLMAENYRVLKENFKWESSLANHFGAMVHTTKRMRVDAGLLDEVRRHLKEGTGWTSQFRGINLHILSNLLCLEENYKELFSEITELYEKLRDAGFKNSTQLPLSAFTIVKGTSKGEWDSRIERMNAFYRRMKENHFWLTSSDDYVYAAILATTDIDVDRTVEEIERCYSILNEAGFHKSNYLQTLSHVLALGEEDTASKCQKAIRIFHGLAEEKCRLDYYGLASVGVLALVASDPGRIVQDVKETYDYIYEKDGYGFWGTDKNTRTILAASLTADYYLEGIEKGILQVTLGNSIQAIVIAQQSAAIAAACAASAAAASTT